MNYPLQVFLCHNQFKYRLYSPGSREPKDIPTKAKASSLIFWLAFHPNIFFYSSKSTTIPWSSSVIDLHTLNSFCVFSLHPLKQKPGVPQCLHQEKPELIDPNMSARSWPIRGWRIILHSRCTKRTPDIDRQQMIRSSLKKIVGAAKITLEKGNGFLSIYSVWKLWNIYSDSFRCQSQRCCGTSSYRAWGLSIDQRW